MLAVLVCSACRLSAPADSPGWRCACGAPYDLRTEAAFPREAILRRPASFWRYHEALPLPPACEPVTLGETLGRQRLAREAFAIGLFDEPARAGKVLLGDEAEGERDAHAVRADPVASDGDQVRHHPPDDLGVALPDPPRLGGGGLRVARGHVEVV